MHSNSVASCVQLISYKFLLLDIHIHIAIHIFYTRGSQRQNDIYFFIFYIKFFNTKSVIQKFHNKNSRFMVVINYKYSYTASMHACHCKNKKLIYHTYQYYNNYALKMGGSEGEQR